jgi:putative transposase
MLNQQTEVTVRNHFYRLALQKGVTVEEINIQEDHIHAILSMPPKYSISEVMGFLKGKIAIKLFQEQSHITKRYWGRHIWLRGYCVSTVGLDEEKIRKYVKWQQEKESLG